MNVNTLWPEIQFILEREDIFKQNNRHLCVSVAVRKNPRRDFRLTCE